jgi:hypothetical protein
MADGHAPQEPRRPRLVVRRDAHRELEFRYRREERLARGTAPRRPPGGSFLKSRTHRVLLLNVALLAAVALAGMLLLAGPGNRARIGPYEARLQAMSYGSTVYVTLSLRQAGRAGADFPSGTFTAGFRLEPGGEEVRKSGSLPSAPGEEVTLGEAFPQAEAARVRAELRIGESRRSLSQALRR